MLRAACLSVLAVLLPGVLLLGPGARPARADAPVVGAPHPALRLPTIDGTRTVDLAALRGARVLLIQFASW